MVLSVHFARTYVGPREYSEALAGYPSVFPVPTESETAAVRGRRRTGEARPSDAASRVPAVFP
jgi:hypothetical protein